MSGSATVAGVAALGAAGCYGAGLVVQHHEARASTEPGRTSLAALARLLGDGRWLAGVALSLVGAGLHVVALAVGSVSLVQPLQVTSLLFALPLGARWDRRRVSAREVGAAVAVVVGVAVFLVGAAPGSSSRAPTTAAVLLTTALALAALGGCVLAVRRAGPTVRAAVLGAAAGAGYAVTALLLGGLGFLRNQHGWSALLAGRPLLTAALLLLVGLASAVVNQLAFQVGELAAALPAMIILNPLLAVALGQPLLGEGLRHGAAAVAGIAAGTVLVSGGIVVLASTTGFRRSVG